MPIIRKKSGMAVMLLMTFLTTIMDKIMIFAMQWWLTQLMRNASQVRSEWSWRRRMSMSIIDTETWGSCLCYYIFMSSALMVDGLNTELGKSVHNHPGWWTRPYTDSLHSNLPSQAYDQQKVKSCILSLEEDVEEIWTYFAKPACICLALPKNYYATDASLQCAQYWTCWFS